MADSSAFIDAGRAIVDGDQIGDFGFSLFAFAKGNSLFMLACEVLPELESFANFCSINKAVDGFCTNGLCRMFIF